MARKIYTPEEVEARLNSLPEDIRTLVYSADMDAVIQKIGSSYQLHIDQLPLLEAEVGEVMLGFVSAQEFVSNLEKTLEIDSSKAEQITKDINDQLFVKIRESMKKLYGQGSSPAPAAPAPSAAPVVPAPAVPTVAPVVPPPAVTASPTMPPSSAAPAAKAPEPHPADLMLTQKTVSAAPTPAKPAEIKPEPYKADPYREPIQ